MNVTDKNFRFLASGTDSLYVGYNLDFTGNQIDFDDLDYRKALLKDDPKRRAKAYKLGDLKLGLTASGAFPYAHVLTHRYFQMKLARRMQPSCMVEFASEGLWFAGVDQLTRQINDWAQNFNLVAVLPNVVSRLDYAVDYLIADPAFELDHFVSRARKDNQWRQNSKVQTLQFGTGNIVIRVYHKSAEIEQQSGKTWFYQIWGLDETERQQVWRIEFQFRRNALRSAGINSVADISDHLGDLLRETSTHHTSLRQSSGDHNRSRWPLHPLWQDLQARINSLPQTGLCRDIQQKEVLALRKRRLMQAIVGSLKGLGALTDLQSAREKPPDIYETLDEIAHYAEDELHQEEWNADVKNRIKQYEIGQW